MNSKSSSNPLLLLAILAALLLPVMIAVPLWNKSEFCRGWGEAYRLRAAQQAAEEHLARAAGNSDKAAEHAQAAKIFLRIAEKYDRIARNPLLPYPSKPLVTEAELTAAPSP